MSQPSDDTVARNFRRQVAAYVASSTGDHLSKPGLILTWLLAAIGAPAATIGLLVPIREAGSLLPQMVFSNVLRRYRIRGGFWVAGSLLQGIATLGMGFAALWLEGESAAWSIVALLVFFSLARGICSITGKDLLGKTIPKTRRGHLSGTASAIAGWVAVGVGLFFAFNPAKELPVSLFATLLFIAGFLWIVAAFVMRGLIEEPGEVTKEGNPFRDALASLTFLRKDPVFLRFCIARALLASTVLSMPFYVVLAHEATGGKAASLGLLMIAASLATALSSATWGKLSDRSSRLTLAIAGLSAGLVGCLTAGIAGLELDRSGALWLYGILFFLIGLAHTGIRLGRKIYLVDHANDENRARLFAVSNTLMGLVLLASGSFGLLAGAVGEQVVILVFAILGILGSVMAFGLPEIE